jgi:hypothetical protein
MTLDAKPCWHVEAIAYNGYLEYRYEHGAYMERVAATGSKKQVRYILN